MAPTRPMLTKGQIAGISIGAAFAFIFVIIIVLALVLYRRRRGQPIAPCHGASPASQLSSGPQLSQQVHVSDASHERFGLRAYANINNIFSKINVSGRGAIYLGGVSLWDIELQKSISHPPDASIRLHGTSSSSLNSPGSHNSQQQGPIEAPPVIAGSSLGNEPHPEGTEGIVNTLDVPPEERGLDGFLCVECGKSFPKRFELNRHTRLQHIKPHKCTVQGCEYQQTGFGKPNDLARHMTNVHRNLVGPQNMYLCPVDGCEYHTTGFGRKDNWKRHVTQKHGISVD